MRVYLGIFLFALLLLISAIYAAQIIAPGFVFSAEFRKSAIVEAMSFIVTVAAIGSLSAAVVEYLNHKRIQPMREFASRKIDEELANAIGRLVECLKLGASPPTIRHDKPAVATGNRKARRYQRYGVDHLKDSHKEAGEHFTNAIDLMRRYCSSFPPDAQDDFAELEEFVDRLKFRTSILSFAAGGEKYGRTMGNTLHSEAYDAAVKLAQELFGRYTDPLRCVEVMQKHRDRLDDDQRLATLAAYHCSDDVVIAMAAKVYDVSIDWEETLSDEEAQIVARVPADLVGGREALFDLGAFREWIGSAEVADRLIDEYRVPGANGAG